MKLCLKYECYGRVIIAALHISSSERHVSWIHLAWLRAEILSSDNYISLLSLLCWDFSFLAATCFQETRRRVVSLPAVQALLPRCSLILRFRLATPPLPFPFRSLGFVVLLRSFCLCLCVLLTQIQTLVCFLRQSYSLSLCFSFIFYIFLYLLYLSLVNTWTMSVKLVKWCIILPGVSV